MGVTGALSDVFDDRGWFMIGVGCCVIGVLMLTAADRPVRISSIYALSRACSIRWRRTPPCFRTMRGIDEQAQAGLAAAVSRVRKQISEKVVGYRTEPRS